MCQAPKIFSGNLSFLRHFGQKVAAVQGELTKGHNCEIQGNLGKNVLLPLKCPGNVGTPVGKIRKKRSCQSPKNFNGFLLKKPKKDKML